MHSCLLGVPTLLLYGKRDKLIDVAISEEMAGYLGNPHKDTYYLYSGKDDTEAIMTRQVGTTNRVPIV